LVHQRIEGVGDERGGREIPLEDLPASPFWNINVLSPKGSSSATPEREQRLQEEEEEERASKRQSVRISLRKAIPLADGREGST